MESNDPNRAQKLFILVGIAQIADHLILVHPEKLVELNEMVKPHRTETHAEEEEGNWTCAGG